MPKQSKHLVGLLAEFPSNTRRIVTVGRRSIGVFNHNGTFHALRNLCPHAGAPLCQGILGGTMLPSAPGEMRYGLEGQVLRCPWHGLEVDITTGEALYSPRPYRVATYEVTVEDGQVYLLV